MLQESVVRHSLDVYNACETRPHNIGLMVLWVKINGLNKSRSSPQSNHVYSHSLKDSVYVLELRRAVFKRLMRLNMRTQW